LTKDGQALTAAGPVQANIAGAIRMIQHNDIKLPSRSNRGYYIIGAGLLCAIAVTLAGCSGGGISSKKQDPFAGIGSPTWNDAKGPMPKGGGQRHLGKPYEVAGNKFYPRHDPSYDRVGVGSWYGPKFHKRMTSNGEWFDMNQLTAAHTTMQLPSYAKVTNQTNGRTVIVRVNDRGPFVNDRIIDLSRRAADAIGFRSQGKAKVRVQYIGPAPLKDPDYGHLAAMNAEMQRGTPLGQMIAGADLRNGRYGGDEPRYASSASSEAASTIAPASGNGQYYVQVAAFADPSNAERTRQNLSDIGNVLVESASGSYGPVYRVRVGPVSGTGQAQAALDAVRARGHHDARLQVASR
jgi:rare lipoprotein A